MGQILVVNPGSSSKKYALYEGGVMVFSVRFESTATGYALTVVKNSQTVIDQKTSESSFVNSVAETIKLAIDLKVIKSIDDINVIGVRVVAPGTAFSVHQIVIDKTIQNLESFVSRAPLHIPPLLAEIKSLQVIMPDTLMVAVSDSAFHSTMVHTAKNYSIPDTDARENDIYRFGYHGLSVASVVRKLQGQGELYPRTIVAHIGSGVSITAVVDGESLDTTMGYAPGSGLVMGSRGGDIDTGALLALQEAKGLSLEDSHRYLQKECGLVGIAGYSDLRKLFARADSGDTNSIDALNAYFYHIKKAIGGYIAVMGGCDVIVLTATAAVRNPDVRFNILSDFQELGIVLDENLNEEFHLQEGWLHHPDSAVGIKVMATAEMEEIARVADDFYFAKHN